MKYVFRGVIECGDECRCADANKIPYGAILIGGEDVVGTLDFPKGTKVICGVLDKQFDGELFVETGCGYSEYTPMDSDVLKVGEHDLIAILAERAGEEVTLVISDEPINVLDLEEVGQ